MAEPPPPTQSQHGAVPARIPGKCHGRGANRSAAMAGMMLEPFGHHFFTASWFEREGVRVPPTASRGGWCHRKVPPSMTIAQFEVRENCRWIITGTPALTL